MTPTSPMLRRIAWLPLIAGLLIVAYGCKKAPPTPDENSVTTVKFSPENFAAIQIGLDWTSVVETLGQPQGYFDIGKGRIRYTFSQAKDMRYKYMIYDIVVDPEGKVMDKIRISAYQE